MFETDEGSEQLADLFRGRSQLLVYRFMFGPDYTAGCPACSALADGFNGFAIHLANHDVMLWAVSRAPLDKLQAYKQRMGWSLPVGLVKRQQLQLRLQRLPHRGTAAVGRSRTVEVDPRPTRSSPGAVWRYDNRSHTARTARGDRRPARVEIAGDTVRDVLAGLVVAFPSLEGRLLDQGELQPFVNLYVDGTDVESLEGLDTTVNPGATLLLLPAMAGGCVGYMPSLDVSS